MAQNKKTNKKKEKRNGFSFFSNIDPDRKSQILKITGLVVGIFAIFTLVASVSYLMTWQQDQSLMSSPDMLDKEVEVANAAGKIGYRWGHFLVCRFLGLGSFALIFLLAVSAFRLFFWNRSIGFLRMTFITVSGAFLASLVLAFVSMQFTSDTFFGGGLGGDAGHSVIALMDNLVGAIVLGLILVVLSVVWLLFASGSFAHWFAVAGMER